MVSYYVLNERECVYRLQHCEKLAINSVNNQLCSRDSYARKKVNTHFIVDIVQLENSPTDEVFVAIFIP